MSGAGNGCADCDCIGVGDWVEHKANTNVFGIVIGFEGSLIVVRLSASLITAKFHEFELRAMEDDEYVEPEAQEADDNVIDFTKAAELRRDTKTEGVA